MKKWRYWLILLLAILAVPITISFTDRKGADHPFFDNFDTYPLVIAHADDTGQGLWPGSTMPFLRGVSEMGVDILEIDVHMTRDGHIVVMHDDTVDRTTNGSGKINEMTLMEIKSLEVGGNWTQDDGATYPYRGQGLRVPTLAELFYLFPDWPMNIEIKQVEPSMAQPFCDLIRSFNMSNKVIVPSFSDSALAEFRAVCSEVATAGGSDEVRNFVLLNYLFLSNLLSPAYQAFQVPEKSSGIPVVTPRFVNTAHSRNLQVHVWTVNDPADMQRYIDMGVDGLMTDRPDLFLELRARQ